MTARPSNAEPDVAPECGTLLEPTALPIGDIEAVVFSGDGARCALCLDVGAFLVDLRSGAVDPIVHRAVTARGGAFSHDGSRLLLVDYDTATLWFVGIGPNGQLTTRELPCDDLVDVEVEIQSAVAPDGSVVALATADEEVGELVLIDWASLEVLGRGRAAAAYGLAFTPDGSHVIAAGERESYVADRTGQLVSTLPRLTSFDPQGERVAIVSDEQHAALQIGRVESQQPPRWAPGRSFLPWGDPNDEIDDVAWTPDGQALAVAVGAWRQLEGFDEAVWRTDLVAVDRTGRRRATFAEPNGLDTAFANPGRFSFSADGSRLFVHAEALLHADDPEPVLALHSYDTKRGSWLGAIVALQNPEGINPTGQVGLDPFGFQEGEGEWAPVLSGRRALGDASLDIDYGEVGSVIAAVTPDGWYGRLDGAPTIRADVDPYDRKEAIGAWLLGLRSTREFGPAPIAPDPADAAADERAAHEAAAQAELEALEAAGPRTVAPANAETRRGAPAWLWTVGAMLVTLGLYWWWTNR